MNGLMLLGEEQTLKKIETEYKKEVKSTAFYKIKQVEYDGEQAFIMDKETAKKVMNSGILRKRDNSDDMISSAPLFSLPASGKEEGILFANKDKKDVKTVVLNGTKVNVKYDSDTWFGHMRGEFDKIIVIVDNTAFQKIPATEIDMSIVELNKTYGENKPFGSDDVEEAQNANEFEKLVKNMVSDVKLSMPISIIKQ
ncbi:lipoprotein BA_5634 family protein [Bacillus sp. FDAARGOS_1420]|uniref:lipoprotein BA_5634 family protein n=1 Tax=unclassified Bacillus (in: firmicutes) TaxID=185979 RepID=UPI001C5BD3D3|nr:lipoprotein BA_5634 family protein [Bacillus sp. FDAARGOS_1420]MBW3496542.1 hypothetical protein [Bacillus sp. FDAARGOS_1420]